MSYLDRLVAAFSPTVHTEDGTVAFPWDDPSIDEPNQSGEGRS
jgi:hypothetical protein